MSTRPLHELDPQLGPLKHSKGACYGLHFICPACIDGHYIFVPIRGVSPWEDGPWTCTDENLATFTVAPSIDLTKKSDCPFHGFIENGIVRW